MIMMGRISRRRRPFVATVTARRWRGKSASGSLGLRPGLVLVVQPSGKVHWWVGVRSLGHAPVSDGVPHPGEGLAQARVGVGTRTNLNAEVAPKGRGEV